MTRAECDHDLARLAVLKGVPADPTEYWEALADIPADVFTAAVLHAKRTRTWFPTPAELRADADVVMRQSSPEPDLRERETRLHKAHTFTLPNGVVLTITKEWEYDCDPCGDAGWQSFWCGDADPTVQPWVAFRSCDRRHGHRAHEWVGACPCRETNPTLLRRRAAAGVRYAKAPESVGA